MDPSPTHLLGDPAAAVAADAEFDGRASYSNAASSVASFVQQSDHGLSSELHITRALAPKGSSRLLRAASARAAASRAAAPPAASIRDSSSSSVCPRNAYGGFVQDRLYTGQEFADGDEARAWSEDDVLAGGDGTEHEAPPGANQAAAEPAGGPGAKARRLPSLYGDGACQSDWAEGASRLLAAVAAARAAVGLPSPEEEAEVGAAPAGAEARRAATPGAGAMEGSAAATSAETATAGLAGASMARSFQPRSAAAVTVGQAASSESMNPAASSPMDGAAPGLAAVADNAEPLMAPRLSATMASVAVPAAGTAAAGGAEALEAPATMASSTVDSAITTQAAVAAQCFAAVADAAAAATQPSMQKEFGAMDFVALIPVAATGHDVRPAGHHKRHGRGRSWLPSTRLAAPNSPTVMRAAGPSKLPQQAWGAAAAPPGAAKVAAGAAVACGTKPVAASGACSSPPRQHLGLRTLRALMPRRKPVC